MYKSDATNEGTKEKISSSAENTLFVTSFPSDNPVKNGSVLIILTKIVFNATCHARFQLSLQTPQINCSFRYLAYGCKDNGDCVRRDLLS